MANKYEDYIKNNPGLKKAWEGIQNPKTAQDKKNAEYWNKSGRDASSMAAFGASHAKETNQLISGEYQEKHGSGSTKVKAGTTTDFAKKSIKQLEKSTETGGESVVSQRVKEIQSHYPKGDEAPDSEVKRDKKIKITVNTSGKGGTHLYTQDEINKIIANSPNKNKYAAQTGIDYDQYVDDHKDLTAAWNRILKNPNGVEARYWIARMGGQATKEAFGVAHAGESDALIDQSYKGATNCKPGTACYEKLERKRAKQCSGGKVWDSKKGKCVTPSGKNCADQGKEECGGNCVDKCTGNTEREEGGCGCVEIVTCEEGKQTKIGNTCYDNCTGTDIMQADGSCKPKEEQKSCANDSPNKPCGTWPDCKVCDEDEVPKPTVSEFGDEWDPWSLEGIEKPTGVAAEMTAMPQLAAVEKKGDLSDSEIVEKRMANLLTGDFAEKAKYEAKTSLAARGLFNTALAESAGLSAVMEHAFQIASMDATHYYGADLEDVRAVNDFAKTTYTTEATTYTAALNRAHEARQRAFQRQWDAREQRTNRKWQSYEKTLDRGFEERMKKLDYDISRVNLKSACILNAKTSFASSESELFQGWGKEELSEEIYQEAVKKLQDQLDSLILSCEAYDASVKKTKFIA